MYSKNDTAFEMMLLKISLDEVKSSLKTSKLVKVSKWVITNKILYYYDNIYEH